MKLFQLSLVCVTHNTEQNINELSQGRAQYRHWSGVGRYNLCLNSVSTLLCMMTYIIYIYLFVCNRKVVKRNFTFP